MWCVLCAVAGAWGKKKSRNMTNKESTAEGQSILVEIKEESVSRDK